MATKTANRKGGPKPTWDHPTQLLKDFELFLKNQEPHKIKEFRNIKKLKEERKHLKRPTPSDYEWSIEEVEVISQQGPVTLVQFAIWKGVDKTTISTGYSEGIFKDTYQRIKTICEGYAERRLYDADKNVVGVIFALKNGYGWVDRNETELSGNVGVPLSDEAKVYLAKATRADEDKGFEDATSKT